MEESLLVFSTGGGHSNLFTRIKCISFGPFDEKIAGQRSMSVSTCSRFGCGNFRFSM